MTKCFSLLRMFVAAMLVAQALIGPARSMPMQTTARADQSPIEQALKSTGTVRAIIELEGAPMTERRQVSIMQRRQRADFASAEAVAIDSELRGEQESFKARARLIAPALRVRTELRTLANAVSIEARGTEIAALAALPGVKRVELVREFHKLLDSSVPLINAPAMWERLGGPGNAGAGVKIAILDTGIDITNPLFNDAGFTAPSGFPRFDNKSQALTNNKVIVAKSFVNASGSDPSALDEDGHGSNVAGIAAGNFGTLTPLGLISGVAPKAYLGNYRVLGKNGSGADDLIAAGLDEAVRDGFDVANLSLGAEATAQLDFLSRAVERAVRDGMVVAVAAGNSGAGGTDDQMTIDSPGIAPSAITVASITNAHFVGAAVLVNGPSPVPSNLAGMAIAPGAGSSVHFDNSYSNLRLVSVDTTRGCGPIQPGTLGGRVALIERGNCNFSQKINVATEGGARAVLIYNKDISEGADGGDNLLTMLVDGTTLASALIGRTNGLALKAFIEAHPDATVSFAPRFAAPQASDVVSTFSSRGPSMLESFKPDIAAPGDNIYSATITSDDPSGFSAVRGTSQATPHVAGAAALVIQQHPTWTPAQVKSALMSSAATAVFTTSGKTTNAGVLSMGAGRVDLAQAATVSASFEPASLSFGILKLKKKAVATSLDFQITNTSDQPGTFTFSVQQLDPGDGFSATMATQATLTLVPGQSATATLALHAAKSAAKRDYTGFVNVTDSQGQTLRVPFWVRFVKKK
ncbi:MAG: minor extracellular serine protease Vpr [Blastocatellia bacterium]